jgi:hypothetical protein
MGFEKVPISFFEVGKFAHCLEQRFRRRCLE